MKFVIFLSLLTATTVSMAADWKVIAETTRCNEKYKILAKEGEKFVYADNGKEKTKLLPESGRAFEAEPMTTNIFSNPSKGMSFTQPSKVEANPPKLDVVMNGTKDHCRMELK